MELGPGATSIFVLLYCVPLCKTYSMVEFMSYSCRVRCNTVHGKEDDVKTNLTGLYEMLAQLSQKLDKTTEDLEKAKQRQLETEKELNATKSDAQGFWRNLNKTVEELEATKQRQLETEKELNATETRQVAAENDLNKTKELLKTDVAFSATMPYAQTPLGSGVHVVYSTIISNIGDAYNDTTGIFTAPFNGTYSFAVTTMPSNDGQHYTQLTINGDVQCTAYSPKSTVSGTCVFNKKLMAGDQVWAENPVPTTYQHNFNIFSGHPVHIEY